MSKRNKFKRYLYTLYTMDDVKAKVILDWYDTQPKYYPLWYIIHFKFTNKVKLELLCEALHCSKQSLQDY